MLTQKKLKKNIASFYYSLGITSDLIDRVNLRVAGISAEERSYWFEVISWKNL